MAMSYVHLAILLFLTPVATVASPRRLRVSPAETAELDDSTPSSTADASGPTTFFEVDRPLRPPPGSSGPCSTLLLSSSFGFTFTKPPATAAYSPPPCLAAAGGASAISLAVLEWRATCQGVQFDRIFGVWLGDAELLRSCTAEPRPNGIVWSISKDITKYASLLAAGNSTLAVYLGNLVNSQYTGTYYANVTLHLYFRRAPTTRPPAATAPADLIVPMSRGLPLNDGLWYQVQNATDVQSKSVTLPPNTYRAVLEVYASAHGDDEFWYTNTPDAASPGPFREVTVRVDGVLVGAAWPFPAIYTGGINPLLWRPITGIGSFNLPTYDIELTPFLGKLLDGKAHEFGFAVTNSLDMWYVDANLHLWVDHGSAATTAGLIAYVAPEVVVNTTTTPSKSGGSDVTYHTTASREFSATGWVKSSYGNLTTNATQTFRFENAIAIVGNDTGEVVNQTTVAHASVFTTDPRTGVVYYAVRARQESPLYMDYEADRVTVTHGMDETTVSAGRWSSGPRYRSLRTTQSGVVKEVVGGNGESWGSRQTYGYEAADGCYFRNVTTGGYSVASDKSNEVCAKGGGELDEAGLVRN